MAQISHLFACFKCCTGQKGNESQSSNPNPQGPGKTPGISGGSLWWDVTPEQRRTGPHLHSIETDTKSVAIISHKSMFWYPKKSPAKLSKCWERRVVCKSASCKALPNLAHYQWKNSIFFLPPDPLKMGLLQARACFNELGLQCELQQDSLKAGGGFLAVAMVLLTQGGGGADPLSMLVPGSAGRCTHTQHTGNRKCFTLPCMRRRMVRVTLRPPSDTFPSFVFILALYLQYLKVASWFFWFFFLFFYSLNQPTEKEKKEKVPLSGWSYSELRMSCCTNQLTFLLLIFWTTV